MPFIRLITIGDSLSYANQAFGASTIANMYARKIAAQFNFGSTDANGPGAPNGTTFIQTTNSGATSQRYLNINNTQIALTANDLICGILMFNTMRFLGPDSLYMPDLKKQLEGILSWLAVPESKKIRCVNIGTNTLNNAVPDQRAGRKRAPTKSGTWNYWAATANTDLNNLVMRSNSNGAQASFAGISGSILYIFYTRSSLQEIFRITVDGINYEVGGAASYNAWLAAGNDWEVNVLRLTGLDDVPHTIVATQTSASASRIADIIAVAGFNPSDVATQGPGIVIGNCPPMISGVAGQGYAFAGTTANDPLSNSPALSYGNGGVETYNEMMEELVQELQQDGLRIRLFDTVSALQIPAHVSADSVHFNDSGNAMLFNRAAELIDTLQ